MTLNDIFNIAFPLTGCESDKKNNHCAQAKANQLDCYGDGKTAPTC